MAIGEIDFSRLLFFNPRRNRAKSNDKISLVAFPRQGRMQCPLELFGSYYGENRSFLSLYNQSQLQYEFIANYD